MDENLIDNGNLQINVTGSNNRPIRNATVSISYTGEPDSTIEEGTTDMSGQLLERGLKTPPIEWSLNVENIRQPYAEYTINVSADGYEPANISGIEVLADTTSIQNVNLNPIEPGEEGSNVVIPGHTLYEEYPPKIPESEVKPVDESGEIVLSRVVVPEFVIVHDGAPTDSTAQNYYVTYRDYIKNVASSEIYATWPEQTIIANVLAIMSFTLNRVYTEWYRNKGYDFTITSSTAFDHKWIYDRNIFDSISNVVDNIFNQYLSRPNVKQPILTQYCDGKRVQCPNWMTQWGSKTLGDNGYSAIEILRNYYGSSMYINTAEQISGVPASWPGYNLDIGSSGDKVRQLQEQLDRIAEVYTAIPSIITDGIYGEATREAVMQFQKIFGLPQTGIVDFRTWYKISQIYVGITRIAELN
ncbi:MAG: peptidoglycan-binding protein [Lachnospiraceae bacterium]|nr:peptidoglycan-binding protein [Lachnospiraceae bacterium]